MCARTTRSTTAATTAASATNTAKSHSGAVATNHATGAQPTPVVATGGIKGQSSTRQSSAHVAASPMNPTTIATTYTTSTPTDPDLPSIWAADLFPALRGGQRPTLPTIAVEGNHTDPQSGSANHLHGAHTCNHPAATTLLGPVAVGPEESTPSTHTPTRLEPAAVGPERLNTSSRTPT